MAATPPRPASGGQNLPSVSGRVEARRRAHLTLREIAAEIGVCHTSVSRWERGLVEPRGPARVLYAASLARPADPVVLHNDKSAPSEATDDALRPRGSSRNVSPRLAEA